MNLTWYVSHHTDWNSIMENTTWRVLAHGNASFNCTERERAALPMWVTSSRWNCWALTTNLDHVGFAIAISSLRKYCTMREKTDPLNTATNRLSSDWEKIPFLLAISQGFEGPRLCGSPLLDGIDKCWLWIWIMYDLQLPEPSRGSTAPCGEKYLSAFEYGNQATANSFRRARIGRSPFF